MKKIRRGSVIPDGRPNKLEFHSFVHRPSLNWIFVRNSIPSRARPSSVGNAHPTPHSSLTLYQRTFRLRVEPSQALILSNWHGWYENRLYIIASWNLGFSVQRIDQGKIYLLNSHHIKRVGFPSISTDIDWYYSGHYTASFFQLSS